MSVKQYVDDIFNALQGLPMEKIVKVRDFAVALKEESSGAIDYSDEWTEEDLNDLRAHVHDYANKTIEWED